MERSAGKLCLGLALVLAIPHVAYAAQAAANATRAVTLGVITKKGEPIENVTVEEVELKEEGKKRTVLSVEPEDGPLDVALILDSSRLMGQEYRSVLVDSAMDFWRALPDRARLTVWTSGGRPSRIVDFGTAPEEGESLLAQVAAAAKNYSLDTIVEASKHLSRQRKKACRAVVVVTTSAVEGDRKLAQEVYTALAQNRAIPFVIFVDSAGSASHGMDVTSLDTKAIFAGMTEGYGGTYHEALSSLASKKLLQRIAGDFGSQYYVRYESASDKPTIPKVKVKRKGAKVRVGLGLRCK